MKIHTRNGGYIEFHRRIAVLFLIYATGITIIFYTFAFSVLLGLIIGIPVLAIIALAPKLIMEFTEHAAYPWRDNNYSSD